MLQHVKAIANKKTKKTTYFKHFHQRSSDISTELSLCNNVYRFMNYVQDNLEFTDFSLNVIKKIINRLMKL